MGRAHKNAWTILNHLVCVRQLSVNSPKNARETLRWVYVFFVCLKSDHVLYTLSTLKRGTVYLTANQHLYTFEIPFKGMVTLLEVGWKGEKTVQKSGLKASYSCEIKGYFQWLWRRCCDQSWSLHRLWTIKPESRWSPMCHIQADIRAGIGRYISKVWHVSNPNA